MPLVRFFAAIRAEAGTPEEEQVGTSLAEVLEAARRGRGERFAQVLGVCSFLVDGDPVGSRPHDEVHLEPSSAVDCLPPFAGG